MDFLGQKIGALQTISLFRAKIVFKIYKIGRRGLNFCAFYCKTCVLNTKAITGGKAGIFQ
jgi:hypothetical protein